MELGISSLGHVNDNRIKGKYNDAFSLFRDATSSCLDFAEKNEIKIVEILIEPFISYSSEQVQEIADLCKSFSSIQKQVHAPFSNVSLCSHNDLIAKASIQSYIESARLCSGIGAKTLTIHPGSAKFLMNDNKKINTLRLIESLPTLLDAISELGLMTCIENMQNKTGILRNLNEIDELFSKVNRDDLFFTYDTSHFWTCNGNVEELWRNHHNRIKNVHVVENDTKKSDVHPALGTGRIDFQEIFSIMRKYEYAGNLILELGSAETLSQSIEYTKKFL